MPNGFSVTQTSRKMSVSAESRMVSAISFGVFWRFAPSTSAIMRSRKPLPFSDGDADDDAVAQDARAAGDGAAVAAALANDGRGFAGDGGFVHAGDAFDDLAVGGNDVARFADDEVALLQFRRRNFFLAPVAQPARHRVLARLAQAVGLRLAAAFRHGFREIGEEHGEPEPDRELRDEAAQSGSAVKMPTVVSTAPTIVTNMTGFLIIRRGFEFLERIADRRADDGPVKKRRSFVRHKNHARVRTGFL